VAAATVLASTSPAASTTNAGAGLSRPSSASAVGRGDSGMAGCWHASNWADACGCRRKATDARTRGWERQVERHQRTSDRIRQLLDDLGESP